MADGTGGFDINQLLQNPLFLGGISTLLADPNDKAKALLGGIQTGSQLQAQAQQQQLRALQLKALQAQQDFNPSDYMKTQPVAQGSATQNALTANMGAQVPSTLGGPIGSQTQMQPGAQQGVSFEPGTPTGQIDMPALLAGGLAAQYSPQQISQIAAIQDPVTAAQQAAQAKLMEPRVLGPQQAVYAGNVQVAKNDAQPPNQTMIALNSAMAQRDAAAPGSEAYNVADALVKKLSGQAEQMQSDRSFEATKAQRETTNAIREQGQAQQRDQYLQNKTNQFSNQLQKIGIPQAQQQLDYIDQTMAQFKAKDGEIPGYGRWSSMAPPQILTEDGQKMRQAVASFANVLLKTRSGAAVTDPEQRRFLEEMGTMKGMPESRLRQGLEMMKGLLESEKRNAAAGVSNDVLDSYSSTPGAMDFNPYKKKGGGGVSIDSATADDIAAAIARKKGQ